MFNNLKKKITSVMPQPSKRKYSEPVINRCLPRPIITIDFTESQSDEIVASYCIRILRNDNDFLNNRLRVTLLEYRDDGSCKIISSIYITGWEDIEKQIHNQTFHSIINADVVEKLVDLYLAVEAEMGLNNA